MGEKLLKSSVNYTAECDKLRKEDIVVDCSLAAEDQHLYSHKAVLSATNTYFDEVRQTNVTTCDKGSSFITNEKNIQEDSCVSVKMEGEDSEYDNEELLDQKHIAHQYLPPEEKTNVPVNASNISSGPLCKEQVLNSDLGSIEGNLSTGGCEFSTLVTDIDIKEEEISWDVKTECENNKTTSSEDESTLEDVNDGGLEVDPIWQHDTTILSEYFFQCDNKTTSTEDERTSEDVNGGGLEVDPIGQHDTKIKIEDAFVVCESDVTHVGNGKRRGEKRFKCSQCTYACAAKASLKSHMVTHTVEKPLKCLHCGYACSRKDELRVHIRSHTGEKPFKCSQCTYACSNKIRLTLHIRTHTGEKPYTCSQCTHAFSRKGDLRKHVRSHTGEKPYKCSQCTYAFSQKFNLIIHIRRHTGEKPYKCSQCTYTFSRKPDLRQHVLTHTGEKPYKCSQCSHAFRQKGNLSIHLRTHTGEKPYECSQCTYTFSRKPDLRKHISKHTGEKPFKCSQCSYACAEKYYMTRHMRTHEHMPASKRNVSKPK